GGGVWYSAIAIAASSIPQRKLCIPPYGNYDQQATLYSAECSDSRKRIAPPYNRRQTRHPHPQICQSSSNLGEYGG
ncbi:MAG: hypothetical protein KDA51_08850, partial [Planctomycetales bacterium]|nr:hypothetical protein [Planctomycetales bacterium]